VEEATESSLSAERKKRIMAAYDCRGAVDAAGLQTANLIFSIIYYDFLKIQPK
jgi:hypothetical protein